MKILLVNKFHYYKGGSETYYFALDELLRANGHEVIHFAMQDDKNMDSETKEYFVSNVDFNSSGGVGEKIKAIKNMFYSREAYTKMKQLLEKERPDIVHMGLVHKQITYSILDAIKEYNIPVVQSVHDLIFVCPCYTMLSGNENCQECISQGTMKCIKKKCVKNSALKSLLAVMENRYIAFKKYYDQIDVFITECNFYKNILEQASFTKSKMINLTNFLPPSKEIRLETANGEYFLFFGRFSQEKGIMTLLGSYRKGNTKSPLYLVGGGPMELEIRDYISKYQLDEKVKLFGYVYGAEMEKLICEAKAVIVPSEWYENCPYSIIEAMGKSRIVIASNIAGLPDLVQDKVTGYLFEPRNSDDLAEKIKNVENLSEETYLKMCEATYEFAKKVFSSENYYEKLMQIYGDLMKLRG